MLRYVTLSYPSLLKRLYCISLEEFSIIGKVLALLQRMSALLSRFSKRVNSLVHTMVRITSTYLDAIYNKKEGRRTVLHKRFIDSQGSIRCLHVHEMEQRNRLMVAYYTMYKRY